MTHEQYLEAMRRIDIRTKTEMQPFINTMAAIVSLATPLYAITDDGLEKAGDGLTDSSRAIIRQCEEQIFRIREEGQNELALLATRQLE